MQFVAEAESPAERQKQRRAIQSLTTNAAKINQIRHMLALAEKERTRAVLHATGVGVTNAEVARIYDVTPSNVGVWIKKATES